MQLSNHASVVIVAAGQGSRFSPTENKVHLECCGMPIFEYSLETFQSLDFIDQVVLVGQGFSSIDELKKRYPKLSHVVPGGKHRQNSVFNGLSCTNNTSPYVFIHDAARPFFTKKMTLSMMEQMAGCDGVIPLLPIHDAIKIKLDDGSLQPHSSKNFFRTQTPQLYKRDLLMKAFVQRNDTLVQFRDEMELIQSYQAEALIKSIPGDYLAEKITTPEEWKLMEALLPKTTKTGIGYDFHPFVPGRPLVLGGCTIPYHMGLEGDSDGDVLAHSILDSLLGALSKGDIGRYIGIKTENAIGAKSIDFLSTLLQDKTISRFILHHIDVTLVCKEPFLNPWIENMVECIADNLQIDPSQINLKSTTDKGIDGAGEGKGIRAISIATIEQYQRRKNE